MSERKTGCKGIENKNGNYRVIKTSDKYSCVCDITIERESLGKVMWFNLQSINNNNGMVYVA